MIIERYLVWLNEKAPLGKEEWINEHKGWLWDKDHVTVYHGTHKDNVDSIKQNGLNKPDPKTGMISVTPDPNTAHGYAAMGGEHGFRQAGAKAVTVPHEDRRVVQLKIPKEWARKHMDHNLSGNIGDARKRMASKDEYTKWKTENPGKKDHEYYQTAELRFKKPIPKAFIEKIGQLKKYAKKT